MLLYASYESVLEETSKKTIAIVCGNFLFGKVISFVIDCFSLKKVFRFVIIIQS